VANVILINKPKWWYWWWSVCRVSSSLLVEWMFKVIVRPVIVTKKWLIIETVSV